MTLDRKALSATAAAAVLTLCLGATPASAAPISWDLTGSGVNAGGADWGNSWSFTQDGVTVTATAWGYTYGSSNNALETAQLGKWGTGLGVCNQSEGKGCSDPTHQVDNYGADDWVLFQFSKPIDITSVRIDPYGAWDRDVSYYVGNVANPLNLTGVSYAGLAGLGFGARTDNEGSNSNDYRDVSIVTNYVNAILFGAMDGEPSGSTTRDYFKIALIAGTQEVTREIPPMPEPASMVLLGTGLVGLAHKLRRRTKKEIE